MRVNKEIVLNKENNLRIKYLFARVWEFTRYAENIFFLWWTFDGRGYLRGQMRQWYPLQGLAQRRTASRGRAANKLKMRMAPPTTDIAGAEDGGDHAVACRQFLCWL